MLEEVAELIYTIPVSSKTTQPAKSVEEVIFRSNLILEYFESVMERASTQSIEKKLGTSQQEAADIANIAMMLADNNGGLVSNAKRGATISE